MAAPFQSLVAELRALEGAPKVTYPYDDVNFPVTERVLKIKRGAHIPNYGTDKEPDTTRFPDHVLVDHSDLSTDAQWVSCYRKYEKLPSPYVRSEEYDDTLGEIAVKKRSVLDSGQVAGRTATVKTTYDPRGESTRILIETLRTNTNGSGDPGNPAFPIRLTDFYDDERGAVNRAAQAIVVAGGQAGTLTESGGTVTEVRFDPMNAFLRDRITDAFVLANTPTRRKEREDDDMAVTITEDRRLVLASTISSGTAIDGGTGSLVITEKEDGKAALLATRLITTIPVSPFVDEATARVETKTMAYQFPARIDIILLDAFGTAIGEQEPTAKLTDATVKTWFVISVTKPTLTFDRIIPHTITINGVKYTDVLHDATVRLFSGTPIAFPATTPSNTQYEASWIGQLKLIDGDVKDMRFAKLWRVTAVYLLMR